jgi:hypothetical protein
MRGINLPGSGNEVMVDSLNFSGLGHFNVSLLYHRLAEFVPQIGGAGKLYRRKVGGVGKFSLLAATT